MPNAREITTSDSSRIFDIIERSRALSPVPIGPIWTLKDVENECRRGGWAFESPSGSVDAFVLVLNIGAAWEISFLATDPDARGQGLMSKLIEVVKSKRAPGQPLWLEVHEQNVPAIRLYERSGFKEVGRRPKYYSDGGTAVLFNFETP